MPAILPTPRPALGFMTEAEIATLDGAPALGTFHAFIMSYSADGTPAGDLAGELRDELAAGCLAVEECTPDGIAAHLAAAHNVAPWVPGALARLEKLYQAAHPAPAMARPPTV